MPKIPTFPVILDECKTVSIAALRSLGYLEPFSRKNGTIAWVMNGERTGEIAIVTNTDNEEPFVELNYQCKEVTVKYRVPLLKEPSNLGKGFVWYFKCPQTGRKCRKLHLVGRYFLHRSAFTDCCYAKQTESRSSRELVKSLDYFDKIQDAMALIQSKNFRMYYAGRPTRRYVKLEARIAKSRTH